MAEGDFGTGGYVSRSYGQSMMNMQDAMRPKTGGNTSSTAALAMIARKKKEASMNAALRPKTVGADPIESKGRTANTLNTQVRESLSKSIAGQPSNALQRATRIGSDAMARKAGDMRAQTGSAIAANGMMDQGAGVRTAQGTEQQIMSETGEFFGKVGEQASAEQQSSIDKAISLMGQDQQRDLSLKQLRLGYAQLAEAKENDQANVAVQMEQVKNSQRENLWKMYETASTNGSPEDAASAWQQLADLNGIHLTEEQKASQLASYEANSNASELASTIASGPSGISSALASGKVVKDGDQWSMRNSTTGELEPVDVVSASELDKFMSGDVTDSAGLVALLNSGAAPQDVVMRAFDSIKSDPTQTSKLTLYDAQKLVKAGVVSDFNSTYQSISRTQNAGSIMPQMIPVGSWIVYKGSLVKVTGFSEGGGSNRDSSRDNPLIMTFEKNGETMSESTGIMWRS